IQTWRGRVVSSIANLPNRNEHRWLLNFASDEIGVHGEMHLVGSTILNIMGTELRANPRAVIAAVPYWFLVLITGSLAMICRLRWPPQFTLRNLFIATTFLAAVLGMSAWLDRAWIGS